MCVFTAHLIYFQCLDGVGPVCIIDWRLQICFILRKVMVIINKVVALQRSLYYIDIWDCLGPGIGADKGHVLQGHNPCTYDNLSGGRFKGTLQRLGSHPNGEWFTPLSPWTSLWGIICASLHSVHCLYFFLNLKVSLSVCPCKIG